MHYGKHYEKSNNCVIIRLSDAPLGSLLTSHIKVHFRDEGSSVMLRVRKIEQVKKIKQVKKNGVTHASGAP